MQAYFRMNNDILDLGLSPNEIKVAVCLYSCVFKNNYYVQIKQSTIADRCGIKKTETVSNIICKLQRKGVIEGVSIHLQIEVNRNKRIFQSKKIYSWQADRNTVEDVSFCMPCDCRKEK